MAQSSNSTFFSQDELNKLKSDYETGGLEAAVSLIQMKLQKLDSAEINIAVTGETGAGKSTFINAMRGLRDHGEGAAKTGMCETTMEPAPYPHPNLPNVCFWNLPGIGSVIFPVDQYLREMDFKIYDFFIIISGCRFRENDVKLAEEIKRLGTNFYFVRSKIDNDLDSFKKECVDFNTNKQLDKIRNDCVSNLEKAGIPLPTVFLISNFKLNDFDFPALKETLANNLENIKKHVFLLSLPNTTLEIVENKRKELENRIWILATLSGVVGAVPIPGLSFAFKIGIMIAGIQYFRQYLGLDDASLRRLADMAQKPLGFLKTELKTALVGEITDDLVRSVLLGSVVVAISVAEAVLDFVPVVGSIFGAGSSFAMIYKLLSDALNELVENAQRVVKAAFGTD
uniref:interferon-inducible GTPase 5-like n=1 Tax=Pristiophorus japonicus TaxID=55135 RepID=UPI00398F4362